VTAGMPAVRVPVLSVAPYPPSSLSPAHPSLSANSSRPQGRSHQDSCRGGKPESAGAGDHQHIAGEVQRQKGGVQLAGMAAGKALTLLLTRKRTRRLLTP